MNIEAYNVKAIIIGIDASTSESLAVKNRTGIHPLSRSELIWDGVVSSEVRTDVCLVATVNERGGIAARAARTYLWRRLEGGLHIQDDLPADLMMSHGL